MSEPLPNAAAELPPAMSTARAWALAVLIAAAFFAAVAPTLGWLDYSSGNENIVVQTALEMRHGGPKLLPQLDGDPRVKKPPLTTWVTAASMRPATIARLDDPKQRDDAYHDLAFQTRLPALIAACVVILATFEIGRIWGGPSVGLFAAMAVCTNYLFLKYMRQSTTDAHLAAWVAVTNACFFHGLLRGRWWIAAIGGSVAAGLAFMCKGPVALSETALPLVVAAIVLHSGGRTGPDDKTPLATIGGIAFETYQSPRRRCRRSITARILIGTCLFAAVALPWFIYVLVKVQHVASTWTTEVGRSGATTLEAGNPLVYLELGALTAPWLIFGLVGLLALWQRRRERAAWVPMIFSVVPLLAMVWFRDRKERYMLPMIAPAAVICGYGVMVWARSWKSKRTWGDVAVLAVHGLVMIGLAAALLIAGSRSIKTIYGTPWYAKGMATWGLIAVAALAGLIAILIRRRAWAAPAGSFVLMLGLLGLYLFGYRDSTDGRSPLKPLTDAIIEQAPGAVVYDWLPRGRVDEQIALYLNRTVLRADPATLKPIDRPMVLIMRQGKSDERPQPPAEWKLLSTAEEGAATWLAFVRRP
ncbi:MAG: family glycosyltransferase [Phycisphaerales bacterium]|nr:family glycosyltransferase [Phycisphaerales bacterium]